MCELLASKANTEIRRKFLLKLTQNWNICYRTKLNAKLQDIEKAFSEQFIDPESYTPMAEIKAFDFLETPVVTDENPGEIQMFNWGLIPFWAKDDKIKKYIKCKNRKCDRKTGFSELC